MKAWIVTSRSQEEYSIEAIFLDRKKAERYADRLHERQHGYEIKVEEDLRQFGVKVGCLAEAARKVAAEFGKLSSQLKNSANDDGEAIGRGGGRLK